MFNAEWAQHNNTGFQEPVTTAVCKGIKAPIITNDCVSVNSKLVQSSISPTHWHTYSRSFLYKPQLNAVEASWRLDGCSGSSQWLPLMEERAFPSDFTAVTTPTFCANRLTFTSRTLLQTAVHVPLRTQQPAGFQSNQLWFRLWLQWLTTSL